MLHTRTLPTRYVVVAALLVVAIRGCGFWVADLFPPETTALIKSMINVVVSLAVFGGLTLGLVSLIINVPRAMKRFRNDGAEDPDADDDE